MVWVFAANDVLGQDFYARSTLRVAGELPGMYVVVKEGRRVTAGKIIETEAYIGEEDPACHAHRGRTPRNAVMYGPPGHAYVYFTYGNHFMLNIVTEREGFPAAVLIRALEPVTGICWMIDRRGVEDPNRLCRGPGNLTAALGIDRSFNDLSLAGPRIFVCRDNAPSPCVQTTGRVGVNEGSDRPWRFFIPNHPGVSAYRMGTKAMRKKPESRKREGKAR